MPATKYGERSYGSISAIEPIQKEILGLLLAVSEYETEFKNLDDAC